jgi:Holliday junction resolvase-like predicted endonuclease
VAKVVRDGWLGDLHARYPAYELIQHKGYGVSVHRRALAEHGPSAIHRRSYGPIAACWAARREAHGDEDDGARRTRRAARGRLPGPRGTGHHGSERAAQAGEIDLVARDGDETVFVEVKTRVGDAESTPDEAITEAKLARMERLAEAYLDARDQTEDAWRVDVVAVVVNRLGRVLASTTCAGHSCEGRGVVRRLSRRRAAIRLAAGAAGLAVFGWPSSGVAWSAEIPEAPASVSAHAVAAIDASSGALLYARRPFDELPPASLTKMVTALVALERAPLDHLVRPARDYDVVPTVIGIGLGDVLRLEDALYGLMLNSGNDAALAIAESVAEGSVARFVGWMNELTRRLGLEHTHFSNPHGLDEPDHLSTAYDMAIIGRTLMRHPVLARIVAQERHRVERPPLWAFHNTNPILGTVPGADGIKTGFEDRAGRCLAATAVRDGRPRRRRGAEQRGHGEGRRRGAGGRVRPRRLGAAQRGAGTRSSRHARPGPRRAARRPRRGTRCAAFRIPGRAAGPGPGGGSRTMTGKRRRTRGGRR